MDDQTRNEVTKVGPFYRFCAGFLFLLLSLEILFASVFMFIRPFEPIMLLGFFIGLIFVHVSGSVAFTGLAPKYLLFTHAAKGDN